MTEAVPERFGEKAVRGMVWTGLERMVTTLGRVAVGIVMARLLLPNDYGLVGMLAIFISIGDSVVDGGLSVALIQRKDRDESDWATAFYSNLAFAAMAYGTLYFAAPVISVFYGEPVLVPLLRMLAILPVVNGLCYVQNVRLAVDLRFRAQTFAAMVSLLVSTSVGLTLAWKGCGPWAIVGQMVSGSVSGGAMAWLLARWLPRAPFSLKSFRRLFNFGSRHLCTALTNSIYGNMYSVVTGKAFGAVEIGYLGRATNFAVVPAEVMAGAVTNVGYPIMSKIQDDVPRLTAACARLAAMPVFVLVPVLVAIAAAAEPSVRVLLGDKWLASAPLVKVLCAGAVFMPLAAVNKDLLYSCGRSDVVMRLEIAKKAIGFALLFAGLPFGLFGLCVSKSVYELLSFCINAHRAGRFTGYGLGRQLHDLLPLACYGAVAYASATFAVVAISSPLLQFTAGFAVAFGSYIAMALLFRDRNLADLVARLRTRLFPKSS